jgi:hypothetical protein
MGATGMTQHGGFWKKWQQRFKKPDRSPGRSAAAGLTVTSGADISMRIFCGGTVTVGPDPQHESQESLAGISLEGISAGIVLICS